MRNFNDLITSINCITHIKIFRIFSITKEKFLVKWNLLNIDLNYLITKFHLFVVIYNTQPDKIDFINIQLTSSF